MSNTTLGWRRNSHRLRSSSPHGGRQHYKRQGSEGPEHRVVTAPIASPRATLVRRVSVAPPTPNTKSFPAEEACLLPFSQPESMPTLSRQNLRTMPSTGASTRGITRLEEATIALRQALIRASASTPRVDPRAMMPQANMMQHGLATPMQPTQMESRCSGMLSRSSNGLLNSALEAPQSTPVPGSSFFEGPRLSSNNSVASAASTPLGHPRGVPSTPMGAVVVPYLRRASCASSQAVTSPRPPYDISRPFGLSAVGGRSHANHHSPQASYMAPVASNGSLDAPSERVSVGGALDRTYVCGEAQVVEPLQSRACGSPQMPRMPLRESDPRPFSPSFRMAVPCMSDPDLNSPGLRRMTSASTSSTVGRTPVQVLPKTTAARVVATGSSPSRAPMPAMSSAPPARVQQSTHSRHSPEGPNPSAAKREVPVPVNTLLRVQGELKDILSMIQRTSGGESLEKSLQRKLQDIEAEIHGFIIPASQREAWSLKDEEESPPKPTQQSQFIASRPESVPIAGPADMAAGGPLGSTPGVRLIPVRCEEQTPQPMRESGFLDDALALPFESDLQHMPQDCSDSGSGSGTEEDKYIEVIVKKDGVRDRLGMDIRHGHAPGQLSIIRIEEASALDRANQRALAMNPPGEALQVGDFIVQVNDITVMEGGENLLVQELLEKLELRIIVLRLPPSPKASPHRIVD